MTSMSPGVRVRIAIVCADNDVYRCGGEKFYYVVRYQRDMRERYGYTYKKYVYSRLLVVVISKHSVNVIARKHLISVYSRSEKTFIR